MSAEGISRRQFLKLFAAFAATQLLKGPRGLLAIEHPRETTTLRRSYGGSGYGQGGYGTASVYSPPKG